MAWQQQNFGQPGPQYGAGQGYGTAPGYGSAPQAQQRPQAGAYGAPPPQAGGYGAPPAQAPGYGQAAGYGAAPPGQAPGQAPRYGAPPGQAPGYGAQPAHAPGYGAPPGQAPGQAAGYGAPPGQAHGQAAGYGAPPGQAPGQAAGYGAPPPHAPGYGAPPGQFGAQQSRPPPNAPPPSGGYPPAGHQYGAPPPHVGGFGGPPPPPGMSPDLWHMFQAVDQDKSGQINAIELQQALMNGDWSPFNPETCRLMIGMFDRNKSGTIDAPEFAALWKYIQDWKSCFERFDTDRSGNIDCRELQNAFNTFGYRLSPSFCALCVRVFDRRKSNTVKFDDFIQCCVLLKSLTDQFQAKDSQRQGIVQIRYEEFLMMCLDHV